MNCDGGVLMRLLVCGGAGFIGSTFVRLRVREHGDDVTVLDKLTYAGRRENLHDVIDDGAVRGGRDRGSGGCRRARSSDCEAIVNFAAETHVDRSISGPEAFSITNVLGTHVLLEAARSAGHPLRPGLHRRGVRVDRRGLVHRGVAARSPPRPTAPRRPAAICSSPATSTRTGWRRVICRGSNNYGPHQYPEKLIPLMILNALAGDRLPVYGDGAQRSQLAVRRGLRARDRPRAGARQAR